MESCLSNCRKACSDLLNYILKHIESFPDAYFPESDLIKISKSSFETLKEHNYLQYINVEPEEQLHYDKQGNERFIKKINGKYYGFSTENSATGEILLTKEDITYWSFNIKPLLNDIKLKNNLSGTIDDISLRVFFIGTKNKTGVFLALFTDEKQAELELLSLKPKVAKFDTLLVLCPSFTITSQSLLSKLETQSIKCTPFNNAFPNNDFILDSTLLEVSEPKPSPKTSISKFPIPPGTTWQDVIIQFISVNEVKITVGTVHKNYNFAELGFKDERRGDVPDSQWQVLIILAESNNQISWETKHPRLTEPIQRQLNKRIQTIRKRLQTIMGIDDDPFYTYQQIKIYKTKFKILPQV